MAAQTAVAGGPEVPEVQVTIDRPIKLGLREPRHGIVHQQCMAEGESQALAEGLNWTLGRSWTQRGVVAVDDATPRKAPVCAICDRELDPPIVLTGLGPVCRRCVSDLVTTFFARLDEVDPTGRRRVPLASGTTTRSQVWVSTVASGGSPGEADSDDDLANGTEEMLGSVESLKPSRGVGLTITDPDGIVSTMSVAEKDGQQRYLINQVGPDGESLFEAAIPIPSEGRSERDTAGNAVLVPHFILALHAVADDVLSEHLNGRL